MLQTTGTTFARERDSLPGACGGGLGDAARVPQKRVGQ